MNKLTLTPEETAKQLGIGKNKVYELIKQNTIPNIRIGRKLLIPVENLEKWLHVSAGGVV